jgi:hypothetical protein
VSRPIDTFMASANQVSEIAYGRIAASNACLAKAGFPDSRFTVDKTIGAGITGMVRDRVVRADLYGFFDTVADASQYGYHRAAWDPGGWGGTFPIKTVPQSMIDTCTEVGTQAAGSADDMDYIALSKLPDGGPPVPSSDSRYVSAVAKWSACMKDQGFPYTDPLAAVGDAKWRTLDAASPQEIATATADVQCKISTNLIGIAVAVETAYDQRYIDAHADALTAYQARVTAAVRRSAADG